MKTTVALFLTAFSTASLADCVRTFPEVPVIPDGRVANQAQMYAAQEAVKSYVKTGVTYLNCRTHLNFMNHNRKVRALENAAAEYNAQLAIFRERPEQVATK